MILRGGMLGLTLGLACILSAETVAPKGTVKTVTVEAGTKWIDTEVDIGRGARLKITGTGSIQYPDSAEAAGPDGLARGWKDLLRILPLNSAGRGALIGRFGEADFSSPFAIGASREITSAAGGRLYLGINQETNGGGEGSFSARIEILGAGEAQAAAAFDQLPVVAELGGVDARTLARIPRRVSDVNGNPGDMVNFLLIGSEAEMQQAFASGGWVRVDRTKRDAVIHGLIATLSKESYVELPMSELYLFGRAQDYGMAHAEPFAVIAQRHHLRIWKAPFDLNGRALWAGAATHDVGFDRDNRNGGITHKIDPQIDLEKKFVGESLNSTGLVEKIALLLPRDAIRSARTATGGGFQTDGKILVMLLADSGATQ